MRWLDRLENRLHWLSFPGLFKWITLLGVLVYAWQWVNPEVSQAVDFDRSAILNGEWWRIITFIFDPGHSGTFTALGALFLFFAVMISFLVSDSLETVWPPVRVTLYILTGWVALGLALALMPAPIAGAGRFLYMSMFFAFATYFPRYEFLLFFVLPVQVRFIAWIMFGFLLLATVSSPFTFPLLLAVTLPYLIWVLPHFLKNRKQLASATMQRQSYQQKSRPAAEAFHRCETCGRTEKDNPDLNFRTMEDGTEFCTEHLPK